MKLICLTGIDGAGKTTLSRNLVAALRLEGKSAVYVYGRTYPVVSRVLMLLGRLTLLRKNDQWQDYKSYTKTKKETMRNPLLTLIYTGAILVDYYLQIWLKLLPHLLADRIVVLDRYVYDTVISDLTVHLNYSAVQTDNAIKKGMQWLPTPVLTAVIDLPAEVAFSRKNDVPHVDYLNERRMWYQGLLKWPEVIQLDGESAPEALLAQALTQIEERQTGVVPA
ncbi:hypothetical protein KFU94_21475 [Chloroflexi bacterium TSY]|nr:hypothetical protein [Chloroflexi bacterium TSY]